MACMTAKWMEKLLITRCLLYPCQVFSLTTGLSSSPGALIQHFMRFFASPCNLEQNLEQFDSSRLHLPFPLWAKRLSTRPTGSLASSPMQHSKPFLMPGLALSIYPHLFPPSPYQLVP
ncbi:hypothetical protein B0F90DRAFT_625921 [Multifurca ochricompacta]|uniref:Secreted protein n=1 Tax=Multifurca ochricompacta TaxID=376703 RepID=A0AAD4QIV5_9AGAM|nr:hypothetical protein B0F90DRAFT_625921 [Multifurca ochricompacta]